MVDNRWSRGIASGVVEARLPKYCARWVRSADELDADLWQRCFPPPLEGKWWYRTLEMSGLEDQFEFFYLEVQRDGSPIGIVPVFLMDVPMTLLAPEAVAAVMNWGGVFVPGLRCQRTLFVGSPCAEEGTVGLVAGVRLEQFIDWLQYELVTMARSKGASMLVWKDLPATVALVLDRLTIDGRVFRVVSYPGTKLSLPTGGFDDYLQTLKKARRQNLKRKLSASRQHGSLIISYAQRPDEETLKEAFALFWQTYKRGTTKFERLNLQFFREIACAAPAWFVFIREQETNRMVAFRLFFHIGSCVINKFIGMDYAVSRQWSLLFRLWEAGVDGAMQAGAREIQSGQTGYSAKLETGHHLVPLTNYVMHMNPLVHRLLGFIARGVSWSTLDPDLAVYLAAHPEESDRQFA